MPATLQSRFPMIIAELRPKVSAAVKEAAEAVAADAAAKAPSGPGEVHIKEHFGVERRGPAEYVVYNDAVAESGREVPYAIAVEFGHTAKNGTQVAPRPFLIPAMEENTPTAAALVTAVLRGL